MRCGSVRFGTVKPHRTAPHRKKKTAPWKAWDILTIKYGAWAGASYSGSDKSFPVLNLRNCHFSSDSDLKKTSGAGFIFVPNLSLATLRPFIMRSDSELLIFIFRSEKRMGLLMQSDFAKSDGIESDFENPMAQGVRFWPKIRRLDPSDYHIEK